MQDHHLAFPIGKIALLGSGETSSSGGQVYDLLAKYFQKPIRVAVMETPAGFELNADAVAGRVADYLRIRLQNHQPEVATVAARKKNTAFSPDDPTILQPLFDSEMIFLGPGSPSYAVRQLEDSLAWNLIQSRHRQGAALILASAAVVAASSQVLPVYEIFKVGEDIHWKKGLGLLEPFGLNLAMVPHWNNNQGGTELDTSRCYMGKARFDVLQTQLDKDVIVLGIEELTGIVMDFQTKSCQVVGRGRVHIIRDDQEMVFAHGEKFALDRLGNFHLLDDLRGGIDPRAWQLLSAHQQPAQVDLLKPPEDVIKLAQNRQQARERKAWAEADGLRYQINAFGWSVEDSPEGPRLTKLAK